MILTQNSHFNFHLPQMQFYQLTRLLYDHHRELYEHFEKYEISPVLYSAPWFLTLFASQFPISFVSRLFDFIFLFGLEAIFRVSLSLLAIHKQSLMNCNSFESIIYYLKNDLVETENGQLESIFNIAFALDITRQLLIYEIEYQVIQEEMQYQPLTITYDSFNAIKGQSNLENQSLPNGAAGGATNRAKQPNKLNGVSSNHLKASQTKVRKISCSAIQQPPSPYHHLKQRKISSSVAVGTTDASRIDFLTDTQSSEKIKELEKENKNLKNRNMEILDQLHVFQSNVYSLESSLDSYKSTVKLLERRVRALEDERDALLHMVSK